MARSKSKKVLTPSEIGIIRADVAKLAGLSRLAIRMVAGLMALVFAFLLLSPEQVAKVIETSDEVLFYKVGLFLYYTSWVFGAKFDVDIEEQVYIKDSAQGRIDWKTYGVIVIFTIVALAFLWLQSRPAIFGLGLIVFILVNVLGWKTICERIRTTIDDSETTYRDAGDYFSLEKLRLVSQYMRGRWQVWRFATMLALALVLAVFENVNTFFDLPGAFEGMTIEGLPARRLAELAPSLFFVAYVGVAEGWMWIERINVHHCVNVMDMLGANFRLEPKAGRELQAIAPRSPILFWRGRREE